MATALDNYDTQMMDYSVDIDVQMHPTDSWFQDEAAMEAETEATQYSGEGELVDVEVDMDHDEGFQNPEYEMTDDAEYYTTAPEIEDAIVTDASHPVESIDNNPPLTHDDTLPPAEYAVVETDSSVEPNYHSSSTLVQPPQPHDATPEDSGLQDVQAIDTGVTEYRDHSSSVDLQTHHSEHSEGVEPILEAALPEIATNAESSVVVPDQGFIAPPVALETSGSATANNVPESSSLHVDPGVADNPVSELSPTQVVTSHPADLDSVPPPQREGTSIISTEAEQRERLYPSESENTRPQTERNHSGLVLPSEDANAAAPHFEEPSEANDNAHVSPPAQQGESDVAQDPHEVSDGVYIDPPPAVLLTLALVDHRDVCLFNQPTQADPSTSSNTAKSYELFLYDHPTLYYEPLTKLFETLRSSASLSQLVELTHVELVLDAYDLQLVISEDNVFARETSLHDLNILHDYSDMSGPLRLRLQSATPRFITRYRLLQDQLLQLNMASDDEESHSENQDHVSEYDDEQQQKYRQQQIDQQEESQDTEGWTDPQDKEDDRGDELPEGENSVSEPSPQDRDDPEVHAEVEDALLTEDAQADTEEVPHIVEEQLSETTDLESEFSSAKNTSKPSAHVDEVESTENEEHPLHDDNDDARTVQETTDDLEETSEEVPSGEAHASVEIGDDNEPAEQSHPEDLPDTENAGISSRERQNDAPEEFNPPLDDSNELDEVNLDTEDGLKDTLASPDEEFYEWDDESYSEEADNTVLEAEDEASSAQSSTTLSSKTSKRSFENVDEDEEPQPVLSSPGSKRLRTE